MFAINISKYTKIIIALILLISISLQSCQSKKRVGAVCDDGWHSTATGSGACSHHGGVDYWLYEKKD